VTRVTLAEAATDMVNAGRQAGCRIVTDHRMTTSAAIAIDIGNVITHQEMCLLGTNVNDTFSIRDTTSMVEVTSNESAV